MHVVGAFVDGLSCCQLCRWLGLDPPRMLDGERHIGGDGSHVVRHDGLGRSDPPVLPVGLGAISVGVSRSPRSLLPLTKVP